MAATTSIIQILFLKVNNKKANNLLSIQNWENGVLSTNSVEAATPNFYTIINSITGRAEEWKAIMIKSLRITNPG